MRFDTLDRCRRTALALAGALLMVASLKIAPARAEPLTVFAAASLTTAMDDVAAAWEQETGETLRTSYAASSALARQIEQGAPADVYISADEAWMDELSKDGRIEPESRRDLLANAIVLVARADSSLEDVDIGPDLDLAGLLGDGRLAVAETTAVPAGRYARASLESLDLWNSVEDRLAQAENVRATLLLVSRGEAPLGIVYRTDAAADPNVRVLGTFPADSHPPIVYPAAIVGGSENSKAAHFLDFLASPEAAALFEKQGFRALEQ